MKNSNIKKQILIYLAFLCAMILISFLSQLDLDGIWGYGFSYNVSRGLLPYKDFNMVIGPLYTILFSIPLRIFGNYFYVFELSHCLLYAAIFMAIYNRIGKNTLYILLMYGSCFTTFGYNSFCVMLMLLLLILIESNFKYKNIIIGIIIGTILMIKHNIGLFLLIVYIYDNRKRLYNLLSVFIPIIPIMIYLFGNNIFNEYVDFCFFGMGNFLTNLSTDFASIIPYTILIIPIIKDFIKKKNIKSSYILAFQILVFPIFDQGHIIPGLIPVVYYYLSEDILSKKFSFFMKYFIAIGFMIMAIIKPRIEADFISGNNYLKYQFIRKDCINYLEMYDKKLDMYKKEGADIYLLIDNSYIVKLYRNETLDFYDLINRGNLGSDEQKYIDMMDENCEDKKCYYILDYYFFHSRLFDQRNTIFKDYVLKNMKHIETLQTGDEVYTNK